LVRELGTLGDEEVIAGCRERFEKYLAEPDSLSPDLRGPVLKVVGRYADEATWNKLHEFGRKTSNAEERENCYAALTATTDPKLVQRALQIALTDERPTSRAVYIVPTVARDSGHPEIAWQFAKTHMKDLLAKADALSVNSYAPSLFSFFSDPARIAELDAYAKAELPPAAAKPVAKAVDEIEFRADFKKRLIEEMSPWGADNQPRG
jgi:aminopeptidase N